MDTEEEISIAYTLIKGLKNGEKKKSLIKSK